MGMSRPLLNSAGRCLLVMLCGFQFVLKFLLGCMRGVMRREELIQGAKFTDGIEAVRQDAQTAAA